MEDDLIRSDYYICSGALNILTYSECEIFIKKCFDHSKKAFIFNFLQGLTFNKILKSDIITICEKLGGNIKLKEGYLDNDFTIIMIK